MTRRKALNTTTFLNNHLAGYHGTGNQLALGNQRCQLLTPD